MTTGQSPSVRKGNTFSGDSDDRDGSSGSGGIDGIGGTNHRILETAV